MQAYFWGIQKLLVHIRITVAVIFEFIEVATLRGKRRWLWEGREKKVHLFEYQRSLFCWETSYVSKWSVWLVQCSRHWQIDACQSVVSWQISSVCHEMTDSGVAFHFALNEVQNMDWGNKQKCISKLAYGKYSKSSTKQALESTWFTYLFVQGNYSDRKTFKYSRRSSTKKLPGQNNISDIWDQMWKPLFVRPKLSHARKVPPLHPSQELIDP